MKISRETVSERYDSELERLRNCRKHDFHKGGVQVSAATLDALSRFMLLVELLAGDKIDQATPGEN